MIDPLKFTTGRLRSLKTQSESRENAGYDRSTTGIRFMTPPIAYGGRFVAVDVPDVQAFQRCVCRILPVGFVTLLIWVVPGARSIIRIRGGYEQYPGYQKLSHLRTHWRNAQFIFSQQFKLTSIYRGWPTTIWVSTTCLNRVQVLRQLFYM